MCRKSLLCGQGCPHMASLDFEAPRARFERRGSDRPVAVLGGGPAGLTAGYLLARQGRPVIVFEAEDQVGGIAKTEVRDGYRFDLGGHRFFTKSKEVDDLWHEVMREEFLKRPRMSRIYWNGKFLDYPLNGTDVIKKLGPVEVVRSGLSYLWALVKPKGKEENLEQWVSNRFGKRLYQHFFKGYTEKVWGVPTTELRAEWAAQRIKGLSFFSAAKAAFLGNKGNKIKSLIGEFHYPRFGPGQMWETMADEIIASGGEVRLGARIQNYRSWSPWMVPDQSKACVGLEYFCFQGDDLWEMSDEGLVELAKDELARLGLADRSKVQRGFVTRVPLAYPMYDADYAERVQAIRDWLEGISNLQQVGRNGLHRYNNSDHSMLTAIRAVENVVGGARHDIWAVNAESVYHEEQREEEHPYKRAPDTKAMREPLANAP